MEAVNLKAAPPPILALIGPKHCGKTSALAQIEKQIRCRAVDLDIVITEQCGKSPRELFGEGIAALHKAETETLATLLKKGPPVEPLIIATGGGIIDNHKALQLLSSHPDVIIVNLEISVEMAWRRIEETAQKEGRLPPFLATKNPQSTHRDLHERRARACKKAAGISVCAESKTPAETAREIIERVDALNRYRLP